MAASCGRMAAGGHEMGACPSCCVYEVDINDTVWRKLDESGRLPARRGLGLGLEVREGSTQALPPQLAFPSPVISRETPLAPQVFSGRLLASYTLEVGQPWDVNDVWVPAERRHPG